MNLDVVDILSVAGGRENEDRAGVASPLAWVIDGATDVVPEPLTRAASDAAWFAEAMHETLSGFDAAAEASLAELPRFVAGRLAPRFAAESRRPAAGPEDHPSASAIVVRISDAGLEFVSLGDCVLLVENGGRMSRIGIDESDAGDRWVADMLTGKSGTGAARPPLTRAELWPILRAQRAAGMNQPSGYGVFSVTAPPPEMIRHGTLEAAPGSRVLLASDGLMRLVDVFRRYDAARLFAAAWSQGLAPLLDELRALETADSDCMRFPRAKTSDDTTALLLRITP